MSVMLFSFPSNISDGSFLVACLQEISEASVSVVFSKTKSRTSTSNRTDTGCAKIFPKPKDELF